MTYDDIEVGVLYVGDGYKTRLVEEFDDGITLRWAGFGVPDGMPAGGGRCSYRSFLAWASRPATSEERSQVRWDLYRQQEDKRSLLTMQKILGFLTDDILHDEHKRRNLAARYHEDMPGPADS